MIAHLSGKVIAKEDRHLILDVNGVGYLVNVPNKVLENAETHLPLQLHIHSHIREEDFSLYGFQTTEELKLFKLFISVSGIGPRIGLDLFASPIENIKQAILTGHIPTLTAVPGIGKKTAERLILELKDKIATLGSIDESKLEKMAQKHDLPLDVMDALESLGYKSKDIHRVFRGLKDVPKDSETLIRTFLKNV